MTDRPFRFGVVAASAPTGTDWLARAQRIEALGYATLLVPDVLRFALSPLPALAAAAAVTHTLRLGTYVLANDYRHPVLLAKEAATLDVLSDGRLELGMGAGRPAAAADNRMLGLTFDSGGVRLARLAESLGIVKRLLAGETVTTSGTYYSVTDAQISPRPIQQPRPPILVAASGRRMLELAARDADIIALGGAPDEPENTVAEKISRLREAAGARFDDLELNVNLMAVGDQVPRYVSAQLGLSAETLQRANSVAAISGSVDQMCAQLIARRARLGISYITISDELMDALAPVVERLSGT
jgi:probable F420-dependent oxidoreductase